MAAEKTMQRNLAEHLLKEDSMIVESTPEMMRLFPMPTPEGDETAWLEAAADVLGDAVELRRPFLPSGTTKLAIKDRTILFNYTQTRTLEDMARDRKGKQDA